MFYLTNLSSQEILKGEPWKFTDLELVPKECRGKEGKKLREAWMTNPVTKFHAYSMFEGVNCNLRIKSPGKDQEGNPPIFMHGLAIDYDVPFHQAEFDNAIKRIENPAFHPNWCEISLSGNYRLVWRFSEPLPMPSYEFAVGWLKHIEKIIPFRSWVGVDEGALKAPERYFTNGCQWKKLNPMPFPAATLRGEFINFSAKFDFRGTDFGMIIPLEVIAEKLKELFPKFEQWPGEFALGSQGPTFWIADSASAKSAIVRDTGMQTFSAHAGKPFFSWPDLLGMEFCKNYKTEQMGFACEGIFYDEKHYYSKNQAGIWCLDPQANIALFLKHSRGMSDLRRKGEATTELERALCYIQRMNRIKIAAPFAFYPEGVVTLLNERVLNLHTRKALPPAQAPGPMPFLETFLKTLFNPPEQTDYFLSWLSYYYKSCHTRTPRSGQALYIAGGTNVGKTFLLRAIIGGLVGGFAEANSFVEGSDNFNSELFDYGLWCIDDGSIAANFTAHKRISEMVKRIVANPSLRCNGKYLKANTVAWQGRLAFSLNTDIESSRGFPDLDISMREKVMIFRTHDVAQVKFLPPEEMTEMLNRELPYLARYLLDYQIPENCISSDPRFGVQSYQEPSLVMMANQSSVSGAFSEILEEWMRSYFTQQEPQAELWEGTSLQLYKAILLDHTLTEAMKPFNVQAVGRHVINLAAKKVFDIEVAEVDGRRIITIRRDEKLFPRPSQVVIPQNGNTFQKPQ